MRLVFCGAAHEVTGSCPFLEVGPTKLLVDCGMEPVSYTHLDRAIGREPTTDMERSGMEVCTARVRKLKISCTPLCLHKRRCRRGQGDRARARYRHGAKRNGGVHCEGEKAEDFLHPLVLAQKEVQEGTGR